jgi:pimeloyl-ACP methyl ester carboxylesterase
MFTAWTSKAWPSPKEDPMSNAAPQSNIQVNGVHVAYIEQGQGEPVVFVHGGVGDYRAWGKQMDDFASRYRAIALSCRGYWPNQRLAPDELISLDTFVEDLAAFISELDAGPVHLVGHSSPGGFGSLVLASRYPELLRTLVLAEPPAFPLLGVNIPPKPQQLLRLLVRNPLAVVAFIKFGVKGMGPAVKAFERGDDAGALRIFMTANAGREAVAAMPEEVFRQFLDNVGPLKAQIRAGFPRFSADEARGIRVPTLLVSGTESPAHISAVTSQLMKLLPDVARLDIAGATHNMFDSYPAVFNRGVLEFIGRHSG